MNVAENKEGLIDFIASVGFKAKYKLTASSLTDYSKWSFKDGALSHQTNGFFHVAGVESKLNNKEQYLMLYQPQSALTGLIFYALNHKIYVLLQARVEPGNTGIIQYGPTIQSTPANYLKLHGGKATPLIEKFTQFHPSINLITHSVQHDLGKRYYQKSKTHHYLESTEMLETEDYMIWASTSSILDLSFTDNILNADLRSLLSVFDWDEYYHAKASKSNSNLTNSPIIKFSSPINTS